MDKQNTINIDNKKIYQQKGLICPACDGKLTINSTNYYIPHFGDTQFIAYSCEDCNYKSLDLIPIDKKPPIRQILKVDKGELNTKVVRGSDTRIEIHEIGMSLDPGANSSGFFSNIESILVNFKKSAEMMLRTYKGELKDETPEEIQKLNSSISKLIEIIAKLNNYIEGLDSFTLILEANDGNGAILSDKAKTELLNKKK